MRDRERKTSRVPFNNGRVVVINKYGVVESPDDLDDYIQLHVDDDNK